MLLDVQNLNVSYDALQVLRGISLRVEERASIALIGPNGSGKTTLLKALFGIADVRITAGKVFYKREDITNLSPFKRLERSIVYLPQNVDVFPHLTVEENVQVFAEEMHLSNRVMISQDAYALFPFLRLRRKEYAGNLSGGERRLLALTRAILAKPDLALLDEPSAGLAPSALSDVCSYIHELRKTGTALIVVEQDISLAMDLAQECVVLQNGVVRLSFAAREYASQRTELMKIFLADISAQRTD